MIRPLTVEKCPPERWPELLDLLYQCWPEPARREHVDGLLAQVRQGTFDLTGLWGAWRNRRAVAAFMTQRIARSLLAIWPPVGRGTEYRGAVAELCQTTFAAAREQGITHVQALVDPSLTEARDQARVLRRVGLKSITILEFLTRDVEPKPRLAIPAARLSWTEWDPAHAGRFHETVEATYQATLDVPEIRGIRSMAELVDQLRQQERFDPTSWLLGVVEEAPAKRGVIILAPSAQRPQHWELHYLGLVPEARRQGFGRAFLLKAFECASGHARRLELAVDERNTPACALYRSAGFERFSSRILMLKTL